MFCIFLLCLLRVFMLFPTFVPAINNSPTLMEFVNNNSYHYFLMFILYIFMQELTAYILGLTAINSNTASICQKAA